MSQSLSKITEKSVQPFIAPKENDIINLIGKANFLRETSFAIQAANSNSKLMESTPQSVAKAIWNVAISGLTLNPILKMAYLTPRKIGDNQEALLMPSYIGMAKLITDTGSVVNIYAHCVYEGDIFEIEYGTETKLIHKPKFMTTDKDKVTHAYSVAVLHNGSKIFEVMSLEEIHAIRARSDGYRAFKNGYAKTAIWESDFGEMARKTVIKRHAKYMPKSDVKSWEKVMKAIELDDQEYPMTNSQEQYIEILLQNSTYSFDQRTYIEHQVSCGMSQSEAAKTIEDLQLNQLDPTTQGAQFSVTDSKNKVNEKLNDE